MRGRINGEGFVNERKFVNEGPGKNRQQRVCK